VPKLNVFRLRFLHIACAAVALAFLNVAVLPPRAAAENGALEVTVAGTDGPVSAKLFAAARA
jgi:hypothetical protein